MRKSSVPSSTGRLCVERVVQHADIPVPFSALRRCTEREVQHSDWPRIILLAGITNLQWEEVTTPASTPLTTPSPTPESAEATASPSPGPTCAFDVISGDCGATYSCITSPNYTENSAPEGSCVIKLAYCQNYSGSTGPVCVEAEGGISCFSDGAGREKGSSIYADTPAPNPPPPPSSTSHIVVADGECDVVVAVRPRTHSDLIPWAQKIEFESCKYMKKRPDSALLQKKRRNNSSEGDFFRNVLG